MGKQVHSADYPPLAVAAKRLAGRSHGVGGREGHLLHGGRRSDCERVVCVVLAEPSTVSEAWLCCRIRVERIAAQKRCVRVLFEVMRGFSSVQWIELLFLFFTGDDAFSPAYYTAHMTSYMA